MNKHEGAVTRIQQDGPDAIHAAVRSFIGTSIIVSVSAVAMTRQGFHSQMSVKGVLEAHPGDPDAFRIVASDPTYVYFDMADVYGVTDNHTTGTKVIHITIATKHPPQ